MIIIRQKEYSTSLAKLTYSIARKLGKSKEQALKIGAREQRAEKIARGRLGKLTNSVISGLPKSPISSVIPLLPIPGSTLTVPAIMPLERKLWKKVADSKVGQVVSKSMEKSMPKVKAKIKAIPEYMEKAGQNAERFIKYGPKKKVTVPKPTVQK